MWGIRGVSHGMHEETSSKSSESYKHSTCQVGKFNMVEQVTWFQVDATDAPQRLASSLELRGQREQNLHKRLVDLGRVWIDEATPSDSSCLRGSNIIIDAT